MPPATQYETRYDGPSPIADPDLKMVEPGKYDEDASPPLRGHNFPKDLLRTMYHDAARALLVKYYGDSQPRSGASQ